MTPDAVTVGSEDCVMTEEEAKGQMLQVGENVLRVMGRDGVTRAELCRRTGMSATTVRNVLNGYRYPTVRTLMEIREALGCRWEDMMGSPSAPDGRHVCNVRMAHPDMGGFHEYVCGTMRMQFRYRGDMNYCPICGGRADVRS